MTYYPSLTRPRAKPMPGNKRQVGATIEGVGRTFWNRARHAGSRTAKYQLWAMECREAGSERLCRYWLDLARKTRRAEWSDWKRLSLSARWHLGRKPLR